MIAVAGVPVVDGLPPVDGVPSVPVSAVDGVPSVAGVPAPADVPADADVHAAAGIPVETYQTVKLMLWTANFLLSDYRNIGTLLRETFEYRSKVSIYRLSGFHFCFSIYVRGFFAIFSLYSSTGMTALSDQLQVRTLVMLTWRVTSQKR